MISYVYLCSAKKMTNSLTLIRRLDDAPAPPRPKSQRLKPRRERRKAERDRALRGAEGNRVRTARRQEK